MKPTEPLLAALLRDAIHSIECDPAHPATDHMPWDIEGATEEQRNDPNAGTTEILTALRSDPAVLAAMAWALHEGCLIEWRAEPPGRLGTRHFADAHEVRAAVVLDALLGPSRPSEPGGEG